MSTVTAPVHIPLDELALDGDAQREVLRRLGIHPERDGRKSTTELCRARMLDPVTLLRVLAIIGESAAEEDVPELMALPQLCERWELHHHGRLKSELAAIRTQLAELRESAGRDDMAFVTRTERFRLLVSRHLKWERQFWRSVRRAPRATKPTRDTMTCAATRAREEHTRIDETLTFLIEELGARYARSDAPPEWRRLPRALERLQLLLHAQIYREQRWIYPRLVATASMV